MRADQFISIGKIVDTHGYKGLVKVIPLTDFPERFNLLEKIVLNMNNRCTDLGIDSVKKYKNCYLFKFRGIDSKEEAEDYKNALLQVDDSEVYPLPDGYYYHFQLQGLDVYDLKRGLLGKLKEIIETGANDVYLIKSPKYGEILIPAIKEVITEINLQEKKMFIRLLPGLMKDGD